MADEITDYYQALKDQRYNVLLDKEIQLDNARQRALKNTNVGLAAAGMDSAGYSGLARMGVENQYLSAMQNAQNSYQDDISNLDIKQKEDVMNQQDKLYDDLYAGLTSGGFENQDELNQYLTNYGLMKDGVLDENAFNEKFGSRNFGGFNANYNQVLTELGKGASLVDNSEVDITDKVTQESLQATQDELNYLSGAGYQKYFKNFKEGDCIRLSDNNNAGKNVYYVFKDGKLTISDEDTYKKGGHQYWFRSGKDSKEMIVDYDGKTIQDPYARNDGKHAADLGLSTLLSLAFGVPLNMITGIRQAVRDTKGTGNSSSSVDQNYKEYLEALQNA